MVIEGKREGVNRVLLVLVPHAKSFLMVSSGGSNSDCSGIYYDTNGAVEAYAVTVVMMD